MERKCDLCGENYESERSTSKYCSPRCRKIAYQRERISVLGGGDSVPETLSVPPQDGLSVPLKDSVPGLMLIDPDDPKVIEEGRVISEEKRLEMQESKLPRVTLDEPCKMPDVGPPNKEVQKEGEVYLDLEKDLKLDLKKDLGIFAWTKDGIFIRPDISIQQVRNIRRLVEAKHGWEHRTYDEGSTPYSTIKVGL